MQTPAQAVMRSSKPEHYRAAAGTQLRMGSNLASVANNEHTHLCIFLTNMIQRSIQIFNNIKSALPYQKCFHISQMDMWDRGSIAAIVKN